MKLKRFDYIDLSQLVDYLGLAHDILNRGDGHIEMVKDTINQLSKFSLASPIITKILRRLNKQYKDGFEIFGDIEQIPNKGSELDQATQSFDYKEGIPKVYDLTDVGKLIVALTHINTLFYAGEEFKRKKPSKEELTHLITTIGRYSQVNSQLEFYVLELKKEYETISGEEFREPKYFVDGPLDRIGSIDLIPAKDYKRANFSRN